MKLPPRVGLGGVGAESLIVWTNARTCPLQSASDFPGHGGEPLRTLNIGLVV
jgi:hypothetical protein